MVDAAIRLSDLKVPPGNKLHPLEGNRAGQHAIWINDQFRVCFTWKESHAYDMQITDYHDESRKNEGLDMSYERRSAAAWAIHPGEILKQDFLKPMGITGYRLAQALDVNAQTVNDILLKKRGISAEMALRLGIVFGMSAEFWMNLQASYELATAKKALKKSVKNIKPMARAS